MKAMAAGILIVQGERIVARDLKRRLNHLGYTVPPRPLSRKLSPAIQTVAIPPLVSLAFSSPVQKGLAKGGQKAQHRNRS
jgi:hypothetical protein